MRLISVNVGRPKLVIRQGRQYSTSIDKQPVAGPVWAGATGLEGDRQSDMTNHGGPHKAVCCYPREHYAYFAERLDAESLAVPSFGENFTTTGLAENEVAIGDVYRIGDATFQVSQPREPCYKLAGRHGQSLMVRWVHETGFTGFYFRVLEEGNVNAGDEIELVERPHAELTIVATMAAMFRGNPNADTLSAVCHAEELSPGWRERFEQRREELGAGGGVE